MAVITLLKSYYLIEKTEERVEVVDMMDVSKFCEFLDMFCERGHDGDMFYIIVGKVVRKKGY